MMAASKVSVTQGFLKEAELHKIIHLYSKLNLKHSLKKYLRSNQIHNFADIMKKDKKNNSDTINLILLKQIGKAFIYKTTLGKTLIPFIKNELINV
jgi:3-dehydroquinate synthase/shikimate kinase/3-dehydroquinate synthase